MARWVPFVGLTALVLTLLLGLARLSQGVVRESQPELPAGSDGPVGIPDAREADGTVESVDRATGRVGREHADRDKPGPKASEAGPVGTGPATGSPGDDVADNDPAGGAGTARDPAAVGSGTDAGGPKDADARRPDGQGNLTTGALLANVALTQGVFGAVVVAAAVFYGIPGSALGLSSDPWTTGPPALLLGCGFGIALWGANEASASLADAVGASYDEGVREMLAPDTAVGWTVLLGLVLPVIAGVEEFLFRAAIVGAPAAGFGISPWALAVLSSAVFALGHGAQGRVGIAVTGGLGFVLAAGFILSGSLLVVVVAHYLVNALEFVVHEGLGVDRLFR